MSAWPRPRPAPPPSFAALAAEMVERTLAPERLQELCHPEDWPRRADGTAWSPSSSAMLSSATWERALAEIARDILSRPSHQFRARMCALAWRLADGEGQVPALLPFLVEVIHAGSLIVDDIEDGSRERRGGPCLHLLHGTPLALNAGTWMYFWALDLVQQVPVAPAVQESLRQALVDTMYGCHLGQSLDLSVRIGALPRAAVYRTVASTTALKTGALMEVAARLGALAAAAGAPCVEALARFGRRLGMGLQMLDDFGNLNAPHTDDASGKSLEDLRNGRPTWPWALAAEQLDEPEFARLQASARTLMADGADPDGTRARALAAALRMAVGLKGRRQTRLYLQHALAELRGNVGERDELGALALELERLEEAYG
jgi:geranylgeranyl pyrophosphate synthase